MALADIIRIILFLLLLTALTPLLGNYMYRVFTAQGHVMTLPFHWLEQLIYRLTGIDPDKEENWKSYARQLMIFNFSGLLVLYLLQIFQAQLPLNPQHLPGITWHQALNTAVSFMTNTNWQGYAGETTMSYLVQMTGLTVQNFLSAGTGIAVLLALARGISGKPTDKIGNFTVDLTRTTIYVLLPLSVILSVALVSQGIIQNFHPNQSVRTLTGQLQVIPMGPVASQEVIKQLGTNGGGFFNANSAHPFENPTPLSNYLELLSILLIPAALTFTYGKMTGSVRHGWTVFLVMFILFLTGLIVSYYAEYHGNPAFGGVSLMEGKETRFGIGGSVLWAVSTTAASNGSVNAMFDSLTPLTGMVAMLNIMMGEVIFGGVGSGLYGMVIFILLTVFIAGLMVGRTPEYLGKKIEAFEIKMTIIAVLAPGLCILAFTAIAVITPAGVASLNNHGPHGFSEILYAFSSAAGNNGSAFAGLNVSTVFYDLLLSIAMLIGRFGVILPVLAIAGNLAGKKTSPLSSGTFRTDNWLFIILLISIIVMVGGLTFFPALSLGPVVENLLMNQGITF